MTRGVVPLIRTFYGTVQVVEPWGEAGLSSIFMKKFSRFFVLSFDYLGKVMLLVSCGRHRYDAVYRVVE